MKRYLLIAAGVLVTIIVIILALIYWPSNSSSDMTDLQKELNRYKRMEAIQDSLDAVKAQEEAAARIAEQDSIKKAEFKKQIIAEIMDSCNCTKKPVKKTTTYVPPKKEEPKVVYVPAPVEEPKVVYTPDPVKEESYTSTSTLDDTYYEGKDKNIYFCLNYAGNPGWHLPHLAMLTGAKFGNKSVANNQSGYNFKISPQELTSGFQGDVGITVDGVFYAKADFIDKYNPDNSDVKIYIKTTATGWQLKEMTLNNGYYTYKR